MHSGSLIPEYVPFTTTPSRENTVQYPFSGSGGPDPGRWEGADKSAAGQIPLSFRGENVALKRNEMQMEGDSKEREEVGVSRWAGEGSLGMKILALLPVNPSKSSPGSHKRHSKYYLRACCQLPAAMLS